MSLSNKIVLTILVFVFTLIAVGAFAYSRWLHPTGEIMAGIYAIRNDRNNGRPFLNFFLMETADGYIVFDTGFQSGQTRQALDKLGISPSDVLAVFITHSHLTNIMSLHLFENATVYLWDSTFPHSSDILIRPSSRVVPTLPFHELRDGEIIEYGDRKILAIHTPGHTSDSVSFLVDDRYLFAGDLFASTNHARYDRSLQIQQQQQVLEIESIEYVFTGHFGLFKIAGFFRWRF